MIFGHGDDAYRYGDKVKMDFSSNLPRFADLSALKAHLATKLDVISAYPEPEASELEAMLAEKLGIQPNSIMVTAGATEAIYLIAQLYQGWASIIPQPTFNEYADACKMHNHVLSYYDNDDMELLPEKRLYWLCNPNNPTGNVMLKALMNHVIREQRNSVFVVDQSYEDLTLKSLLQPHEMQDCHNLILIHSMTKKYCIPGLRIGYITASPIIIDRLRLLRQPWTVNALAIEAGKYLTKNYIQVIPDKKGYLEEAARLHNELNNTKGLMLMDSDTNFMLAYIEHGTASQLKQWLIDNYGILIRDASNFHGLDNRCFRVSAQTPRENNTLIAALREYTKNF
ncbi:MAG: pyridoxal phosphate-dependent class II aminotransferase [Prevotella sp.]|nr:pyridoxal phosphate-dependent class II aminotransferase [Prevotella sp.]